MPKSKGPILDELPPRTRPNGRDWDHEARLAQEHPGLPMLVARHVRRSRYESVKTYRRPPFYTDEGHIRVNIRDSKNEDDGIRYGSMYFTWVPNDMEETADAATND